MEFESRCRELLKSRRTEAFGVSFHGARSGSSAVLDSTGAAHHALALLHLEPALAVDELRALYEACQVESGLLALERCGAADLESRSAALGPIFDEDGRTRLIGPPIAAWAAARACLALGGEARDVLERATAQLDAIWSERLPPDTPLPVILHPLESGTPGSALFDDLVDASDGDEWRDELANMMRSASACGLDPERALRAGHPFVVEDPVFCGWLLLALEETSSAWTALGEESSATKMRIRSEMIAEGMANRLWWESEEIFAGYDRRRDTPLRAVTAAGLLPAASRLLMEEAAGRRALARHLRPAASPLWGSQGVSFDPISADAPDPDGIPWRGNVVSATAQGWIHLALLRAERGSDARALRERLEELVLERGFHEFYDAISGEPAGPNGAAADEFTGPALILDMRAREDSA